MFIAATAGFFLVIFLLASISVAAAWMAFQKMTAEESEAALGERESGEDAGPRADGETTLLRSERLSTLSFWDNVLARFDFIEIMKSCVEQAELDWSVGRLTSLMLLCGAVALVILNTPVIVGDLFVAAVVVISVAAARTLLSTASPP